MQQDSSAGEATPGSGSKLETTSEPQQDELSWEPLVLTEAKIKHLWEQIQRFPQVFDDFSKGRYEEFVHKFFVATNVFIDIGPGLGLAAGFGVRPGLDAVLHLVMFDRRLRGRESLFKEIMAFFFHKLQLRRMTALIADDCLTACKLSERIGFTLEGRMKSAILRDGVYHDCMVYGILREELDGTVPHSQPERTTSDSSPDAGKSGVLLDVASEELEHIRRLHTFL